MKRLEKLRNPEKLLVSICCQHRIIRHDKDKGGDNMSVNKGSKCFYSFNINGK